MVTMPEIILPYPLHIESAFRKADHLSEKDVFKIFLNKIFLNCIYKIAFICHLCLVIPRGDPQVMDHVHKFILNHPVMRAAYQPPSRRNWLFAMNYNAYVSFVKPGLSAKFINTNPFPEIQCLTPSPWVSHVALISGNHNGNGTEILFAPAASPQLKPTLYPSGECLTSIISLHLWIIICNSVYSTEVSSK